LNRSEILIVRGVKSPSPVRILRLLRAHRRDGADEQQRRGGGLGHQVADGERARSG